MVYHLSKESWHRLIEVEEMNRKFLGILLGIILMIIFYPIIFSLLGGMLGLVIVLIAFVPVVLGISSLGFFAASHKVQKKIDKEIKKVVVTNPYIYYRDIPDDFGIGIYALLLDCKITVRDFKAAIIDLCAKGYIKIRTVGKSFEATILDKDQSTLLSNEKFILNWIALHKDSKLTSFPLSEWENRIKEDAIELGFATKRKNIKADDTSKRIPKLYKIAFLLALIIFIGAYVYLAFQDQSTLAFPFQKGNNAFGTVMMCILWVVFNMAVPGGYFIASFIIFVILGMIIGIFYYPYRDVYYFKMHRALLYTD